jgi:hypothetical protein
MEPKSVLPGNENRPSNQTRFPYQALKWSAKLQHDATGNNWSTVTANHDAESVTKRVPDLITKIPAQPQEATPTDVAWCPNVTWDGSGGKFFSAIRRDMETVCAPW